jgi:hypothetical protein
MLFVMPATTSLQRVTLVVPLIRSGTPPPSSASPSRQKLLKLFLYIYIDMYVCLFVCLYVCMYDCVCVCVCVCARARA